MRAIFGASVALLVLAACAGEQAAKGPAPEAVAKTSADLDGLSRRRIRGRAGREPRGDDPPGPQGPAMASSMIAPKRRRTSGWNGASSRSTT